MLDFDHHLKQRIPYFSTHQELRMILDYATRPPGKLFRPKLLEAACLDLGVTHTQDILTLGCALEIHHAYSLVHDDLPCMDNDLIRRGKPSTHAKFGEWKALLIGDTLLVQSIRELDRLQSTQRDFIRQFFLWATSGSGLILGQWIDLSGSAQTTQERIRMHELKTSRLMQIALVGAHALNKKLTLSELKKALRLGAAIGVSFQLLDDLDDLNDPSEHELAVNPFIQNASETIPALEKSLSKLTQFKDGHLKSFLKDYLSKATALLEERKDWMKHFSEKDCELLKKITSGSAL